MPATHPPLGLDRLPSLFVAGLLVDGDEEEEEEDPEGLLGRLRSGEPDEVSVSVPPPPLPRATAPPATSAQTRVAAESTALEAFSLDPGFDYDNAPLTVRPWPWNRNGPREDPETGNPLTVGATPKNECA